MEIKAKGEMAEWSIAAVLKTVEGHTSGGSNPSLSAKESQKKPTESFSRLLLNCDIEHSFLVSSDMKPSVRFKLIFPFR